MKRLVDRVYADKEFVRLTAEWEHADIEHKAAIHHCTVVMEGKDVDQAIAALERINVARAHNRACNDAMHDRAAAVVVAARRKARRSRPEGRVTPGGTD